MAKFLLVPACNVNRSSRSHDPSPQHMRGPGKQHRHSAAGRSAARVRHASTRTRSGQTQETGSSRAGSRRVFQEEAGKQQQGPSHTIAVGSIKNAY